MNYFRKVNILLERLLRLLSERKKTPVSVDVGLTVPKFREIMKYKVKEIPDEEIEPEEEVVKKMEPSDIEKDFDIDIPEKEEPEKTEPEKIEPEKVEPEKVEPKEVEVEPVDSEVIEPDEKTTQELEKKKKLELIKGKFREKLGYDAKSKLRKYINSLVSTIKQQGFSVEDAYDIISYVISEMEKSGHLPEFPGKDATEEEIFNWLESAVKENIAGMIIHLI